MGEHPLHVPKLWAILGANDKALHHGWIGRAGTLRLADEQGSSYSKRAFGDASDNGEVEMAIKTESEHRRDIVEVGRRIWTKGFVASNDGNISVRMNESEILCTPTGVSKGFLTPEMLVVVDLSGRQLRGEMRMSSEVKAHLRVYQERPDVRAVVHAHPPTATGFAVAGIALDRCTLPEIVLTLGSIPLAPYQTPSTAELAESIVGPLRQGDAVLMANHGAITVGTDVYNAYYKMESLELYAQISLVARQLGRENVLTQRQVSSLMEVREKLGVTGPNPGCFSCEITNPGSIACTVCSREGLANVARAVPSTPPAAATDGSDGEPSRLVAEITKRVMAELQRRSAGSR